jgi:2'-5' RNA ligase
MALNSHFFFALKLPDEIKLVMKERMESLRSEFPFKNWVHHEDLHITLAFLGNAPQDKLEIAQKNTAEALKDSSKFFLEMNQLGIFGKQDSPRIFFADTKQSNELQLIRNKVFRACEDAGFILETRPFRPHITIARKWAGEEAFQKISLKVWEKLQPTPLKWEAADVAIYQTHLQRTPKYEAIKLFSLGEQIES